MRKTMRQLTAGIDSIAKPVKVDNNTIRYTDSKGNLRYRLHHTDVVIIHPDSSVTISLTFLKFRGGLFNAF